MWRNERVVDAHRMTIQKLTLLGLSAALFLAQTTAAAEIEGVRFAERLRVGESELRLHNTGLLRYRIIIKGYVAALYLSKDFSGEPTSSSVLADAPRRLGIETAPTRPFARATTLSSVEISGNTTWGASVQAVWQVEQGD